MCGEVEGGVASGAPSPFWESTRAQKVPLLEVRLEVKPTPLECRATKPQATTGGILLVHVATFAGGGGASPLVRR